MRTCFLTLALAPTAATVATASTAVPPVAYKAEIVVVVNGVTTRSLVWSDGVHRKTEIQKAGAEASGSYADSEKRLSWQWGPGYPCLQMPLEPAGVTAREEPAGSETIDGHPTKKVKVTSTLTVSGKAKTFVEFEWRAADLHDLVIQSLSEDGSVKFNVRNIVLGKPDGKHLSFPSPPCKYNEAEDTTRFAAQAAGGVRTVTFSDASCKKLVALPLTFAIPSDYAIQQGGHLGCFWGTSDDLARVLRVPDHADFTGVRRGVFWCRASDSTSYEPIQKRFANQQGTDDQWARALARDSGAKNVIVTAKDLGSLSTLRVTASVGGQRLYMLYIGLGDSPAILINYHPAGSGGPSDDALWQRFLDSIQSSK